MRRPRCIAGLLVISGALAGCGGDPEPAPAAEPAPAVAAAPDPDAPPEIGPSSLDPWPRYRRARWFEEHGDADQAIAEYGACINLLPARTATRPILDLGKLHQRLGHMLPAERCFREVLETFPTDPEAYRTNPDFRDAALGLGAILAVRGADLERASLRDRYLGELRGEPATWAAGPPWTKAPPPSSSPKPATSPPATSRPTPPPPAGRGGRG